MENENFKNRIRDALIFSFNKIGSIPSVLMADPEKAVREWQDNLINAIDDPISKNEEFRKRLKKAVELPCNTGDSIYQYVVCETTTQSAERGGK